MVVSGPSRYVQHETVVAERLRSHFSRDRDYRFADPLRAQAKEICDWIEDSRIMLMFKKSVCTCAYSVPTLKYYDCKENKGIFRGERLG